jgi:hypothetical protein
MENGGAADLRLPQPLLWHACSQWRWAGGRGGWTGAVGRLSCGLGTVVASGGWSSSVAHKWRTVGARAMCSSAMFVVPRMWRGARRCVDREDIQLSHGNSWRVHALLQRRHGHARPARVAAHGAGPLGQPSLGATHWHMILRSSQLRAWSNMDKSRRPPEVRGGDAWCTRPRRESVSASAACLFLFDLRLFNRFKLEIFEYKFKIYKNESCRATIGLQPLQKVTYVLLIRLTGKTWRSCIFSTAQNTIHRNFNSVFGKLKLKMWMSTNYEKIVFQEIAKNFCIDWFWTSIVKFGERARKPNQPFWIYRGLPRIMTLTKVFCANVCQIMSNMFRSQLNLINITN